MTTTLAKPDPQGITVEPQQALSLITIIERAVRDPSVDIDKMERLMQMHERATARVSRELFNAAMSEAQREMRPIAADSDNPQTRSRYASYNALDRALRPIYTRHGFGLSFNTAEGAAPDCVRVVCDVTHAGGHEKPYHLDMPADGKGAKGGDVMTKTHATGAAMSYGMRYLLKMIFNVAVGEDDRDGNDPVEVPIGPKGFEGWRTDLEAVTDNGYAALETAWKGSLPQYRTFLNKHFPTALDALKAKARKVQA
jgi:hypothetical protein